MADASAQTPRPDKPELSPELRAMLDAWQRSDLARVNATRRLLGLRPAVIEKDDRKPKTVV